MNRIYLAKIFSIRKLILWTGDVCLILLSLYLAKALRFWTISPLSSIFSVFELTVVFLYIFFFYIFDLHTVNKRLDSSCFVRMGIAITLINIPLTSLLFLFNIRPYGAGLFMISACFVYLLTYTWRLIFDRVFPVNPPTRIVVLGAGLAGQFLYSALKDHSDYQFVGFLDDDPEKKGQPIGDTMVMGGMDILEPLIQSRTIDTVVLAISHFVKPATYQKLYQIKMRGIGVYDLLGFSEMTLGKIPVYHVNDSWLISEPILGVRKTTYNTRIKIAVDKLLSLIGLIITMPLLLLVALAIKIDSRGPIIYRQKRVGKGGQLFDLYKFRSMRYNAEGNGAVWATHNDPRITRIGCIIRKLRLDEIPQFWNVLKGEMSLVGPRPERPEFVEDLIKEIPYFSLRHTVAPGITGWAQINYPYGASKEDAVEKLQYDIFYIKNLSSLLDYIILARTFRIIFFGQGAR